MTTRLESPAFAAFRAITTPKEQKPVNNGADLVKLIAEGLEVDRQKVRDSEVDVAVAALASLVTDNQGAQFPRVYSLIKEAVAKSVKEGEEVSQAEVAKATLQSVLDAAGITADELNNPVSLRAAIARLSGKVTPEVLEASSPETKKTGGRNRGH